MQITILGHTKERRNQRKGRIRVRGLGCQAKTPEIPIKEELLMFNREYTILPYIFCLFCIVSNLPTFSQVIL